ncbi:cytochrome P450 [Phascolomyces articulosus]|uniref:Cytochrome P450 n=1 Tax=Phascolomyces articulosus TaxID=60185 RepID=A0AAD5P7R7_9FUNG|nr:cytochrome P450 [Phascolomyces articulosus]
MLLIITAATGVVSSYIILKRVLWTNIFMNKSSNSKNEDSNNTLIPFTQIPTPKGSLPYFGHLFILGKHPGLKAAEWIKELGPIIQVHLGVKRWVLIGDPFIANEVFNSQGASSSGRTFSLFTHHHAKGQRGIATPNPDKRWKKARALALEVLSPTNVNQYLNLIENEAYDLVNYLLKTSKGQDQGVDIFKPLQLASFNVIMTTCFGMRAESIQDPLFRTMIGLIDEGMEKADASADISTFLPIISFMDIIFQREKGIADFIRDKRDPLFRHLIQQAIENENDCLLKTIYKNKKISRLDDDDIMVIMVDMVAGATDTTAITLTWALMILCRFRDDVQNRICEELDQFIKKYNRLPTFEERNQVSFLFSVQKECMRYKPTTPFGLPHEATKDLHCHGYHIPKGTILISCMNALHQDPNIYPEPEKFNPERFSNDSKPMYASANGKTENRDHFNFGWGRRICPGIYLAEVEVFMVLVRLFSKVTIEARMNTRDCPEYPDLDDERNNGVTIMPVSPRLRFVERSSHLV